MVQVARSPFGAMFGLIRTIVIMVRAFITIANIAGIIAAIISIRVSKSVSKA